MRAHQGESWHWIRTARWFAMGEPNGEPSASVNLVSRLLSPAPVVT